MSDLMQYKGYFGSYHLDQDEAIFYGKVEYIKALISYEATTAAKLYKEFVNAVDDYLLMCKQENIEPEKPFKGSFNVRVGSALHKKVVLVANDLGISLNQFVCNALKKACGFN
jgi:predicted HicB family RNase H-like nuclease